MVELTEEEMERAARALADWDEDSGWHYGYDDLGFTLTENDVQYYRAGVECVLAALRTNAETPT